MVYSTVIWVHVKNFVNVYIDSFRLSNQKRNEISGLLNNKSIKEIGINTVYLLTGGSNSFWSSSYSHISTAKRFRIKLIWCDPYLAVRNFSRRSFTASPFSVKFTRKFVRFGDRSQSLIDCKLHCISVNGCSFREIMKETIGLK